MLRLFLAAAIAAAASACATQDTQTASTAPANRDCFRSGNISTYRVLDDQHIRMTSGFRDYIITVRDNARDLRGPDPMLIDAHNGWICTGNGLGVRLSATNPVRPLFVENIARAPEEPTAAPATPPAG